MVRVKIRLWVKITLVMVVLFILLFIYGRFINTTGFKVNEYSISASIPDSFNGLKIVHISDINYLHTTSYDNLDKIVKRINLIRPDIVVFTGDLLNINIEYNDEDILKLTNELKKINSNIGKFAVKGEEDLNFDFYNDILIKSDFKLLDNSYEYVYNKTNEAIIIAGISEDINDINIDNELYKILLIHKPDNIDEIDYNNYNLILSGHSLNGYINIPLINNLFLEDGCRKYFKDFYNFDDTLLYISNGIGTKNFRFRILNKPSFNFYRLKKMT